MQIDLTTKSGIESALVRYVRINEQCNALIKNHINKVPPGGLEILTLVVSTNEGLIEALDSLLDSNNDIPQSTRDRLFNAAEKSFGLLEKAIKAFEAADRSGLLDVIKDTFLL